MNTEHHDAISKQDKEKARRAYSYKTERESHEFEPSSTVVEMRQAVAEPDKAAPRSILKLQRAYGNRAVARLIQTKLMVGAAHDPYEQEADRVAQHVMSAQAPGAGPGVQREGSEGDEPAQKKPLSDSISRLVQRAPAPEEEDKVMTKRGGAEEGFETSGQFEDQLNASRGSGSPLPSATREFMESRFGADFEGVRVHTDGNSAQLNREVSAQAFTRGSDIYLGEGKTDLSSSEGKHLLAHELTHVVQQTGGGVQRQAAASEDSIQRLELTAEQWTHIAKGEVKYDNKKPKLVGYHWTGDKQAVAEKGGGNIQGPNKLGVYVSSVQTKEELPPQPGKPKQKIKKANDSTFWPDRWTEPEIKDVIKNAGNKQGIYVEVSNKTTKKEAVGMTLITNPDSVFPNFEPDKEEEGTGKKKGRK